MIAYDIKKLHELQEKYIGIVDMQIETRKDMKLTMVMFCNYSDGFSAKSKFYVYKLWWFRNNDSELYRIEKDLEMLSKKY